jgi:hypothetical protein
MTEWAALTDFFGAIDLRLFLIHPTVQLDRNNITKSEVNQHYFEIVPLGVARQNAAATHSTAYSPMSSEDPRPGA